MDFQKQSVPETSLDPATRDRLAPSSVPVGSVASGPAFFEPSFWQRNKWFIFISVIACGVIAILGFFALRNPGAPAEPKVSVTLEMPETAPSGSEVVVKVILANQDSHALESASLEMVYPTGMSFVSANPSAENLSGSQFSLPAVPAGLNVAVLLKVRCEGSVGDTLALLGKVKYKLAGISADFTKEVQKRVQLTAAGAGVSINGPAQAVNAGVLTYTVQYSNQSAQPFDRVRVKLVSPQGFQFASSDPAPSQGTDTWDITPFPAGATGEIKILGSFVGGQPGQSYTLVAQLLVPDKNGQFYVQTEQQFVTALQDQPLLVAQSMVGGDSGKSAKAGDTLQYRVQYRNNASVPAQGVRIVFSVDSTVVDLGSMQAEAGQIAGNTVTFSAAGDSRLETLRSGEEGAVTVSLRLKDPLVADRTINPTLVTSVKIRSDEYDTFLPGNTLTIPLATAVKFERSATYVSGAVPPKVGQQTMYKIKLSLRNTTSDAQDASVQLFVAPGGAAFDKASVNSEEAAAVTYDASTGKLAWKVGTLAAHTGTFSPVRTLEFTVKVTPAVSGVGKPVKLVRDITFRGTDSGVAAPVTLTAPEVTSQDAAPSSNDGIVVQ
ncbi:MAG: hypothetical protein KBD66_02045 [Candidatus Doudnabacteria bacterium]|nr:hypothetical protein [Candidatus Doudnabacteria bacterium]